jgi:hypothetical protein
MTNAPTAMRRSGGTSHWTYPAILLTTNRRVPRDTAVAWDALAVTNEWPTWAELRRRVDERYRAAGAKALVQCIDCLEERLGRGWPRKQTEKRGWFPGELLMLGNHVAALPGFLSFVLRLNSVASEATFEPVLQELKRGVTTDGWRHVLLQLEVSRAWKSTSDSITFEPEIPSTPRKADLRIRAARTFLVETTSLSRSVDDRRWEEQEHVLWMKIQAIQDRTETRIDVELADDPDPEHVEPWLIDVERVAGELTPGDSRAVDSDVGHATVQSALNEDPGSTFHGSPRTTDGWRRLARVFAEKAHQSFGEEPVWLRVDALDGFFQLTEWPSMSWPDRITRLSEATSYTLDGADHIAGLVLSSAAGVAIGATDAAKVDERFDTDAGTGLRRLIAPHVARETAVIPLRPAAAAERRLWAKAYSTEPTWLDEDLRSAEMPPLSEFLP